MTSTGVSQASSRCLGGMATAQCDAGLRSKTLSANVRTLSLGSPARRGLCRKLLFGHGVSAAQRTNTLQCGLCTKSPCRIYVHCYLFVSFLFVFCVALYINVYVMCYFVNECMFFVFYVWCILFIVLCILLCS